MSDCNFPWLYGSNTDTGFKGQRQIQVYNYMYSLKNHITFSEIVVAKTIRISFFGSSGAVVYCCKPLMKISAGDPVVPSRQWNYARPPPFHAHHP